jgi:hypothetical protein
MGGPDFVINGQFGARLNSVSGDPNVLPYQLNMSVGIVGFSMKMSTTKFLMNGGYTIDINQQVGSKTMIVKGDALGMSSTTTDEFGNVTNEYGMLFTNFNQRTSTSGFVLTYSNDMRVSSHWLKASFTVDTTQDFVFDLNCYGPTEGSMTITGADNRHVRITASGTCLAPMATVEYDLNANGIYTDDIAPVYTSWDSLKSL